MFPGERALICKSTRQLSLGNETQGGAGAWCINAAQFYCIKSGKTWALRKGVMSPKRIGFPTTAVLALPKLELSSCMFCNFSCLSLAQCNLVVVVRWAFAPSCVFLLESVWGTCSLKYFHLQRIWGAVEFWVLIRNSNDKMRLVMRVGAAIGPVGDP